MEKIQYKMPQFPDKSALSVFAMAMASLIAGIGAVAYVNIVEGDLMLISALPFVMAMLLLLVFDKRKLVLLILLFRASGDLVFDVSKFGGGFGIGGLINVLIVFIAMLFVFEHPGGVTRRMVSIWGPLLLAALAAVLYAPELRDAARTFLALTSYCAVFVIAFYMVRSKADFEVCVSTILLSSLIPAAYAFVDIALNGGTTAGEGFRLKSTFSHPNIFAFYLVLNISLVFYRLKTSLAQASSGKKLVFMAYMLLLLALLLLTKTRSAWAACFMIFAVYGALFERKYLLYLILVPALALLVPSVRDRLLDLESGNTYVQYAKLNSFAWRLLLWKSSIEWMSTANALAGYGLNSFKHYSPIFFPLAGTTNFGAHNTYIQWFFETGVVGVICAVWLHFRLLLTLKLGIFQGRMRSMVAIAMVVAYLFFAFSDNMLDYLSFNWYFWFFIGAACALAVLDQNEIAAEVCGTGPTQPQSIQGAFKSNRKQERGEHEPRS
jgi:O-antigen ligase